MQVSHRFTSGRRGKPDRTAENPHAGFHVSLLEGLPRAAAFVAEDGGLASFNQRFGETCASLGVTTVPLTLKDLLSRTAWQKCRRVLSAAFSGLPAEAVGALALRSGGQLCRHLICSSPITLPSGTKAILVQLESSGQSVSDAHSERFSKDLSEDRSQATVFLNHFPDDVLLFDGTESVEEKAIMILETANSDQDPAHLVAQLARLDMSLPHTLHVSECVDQCQASSAADGRVCEIRLVPAPGAGLSGHTAALAFLRHGMDCPIHVAENRRLAYQDPLTGLQNRRAFKGALARELQRMTAENETGLAVFYVDLDEFKKVNDHGGHDAGDDMLIRVAESLRLSLGEFGTVARIGGDEFACTLPCADEAAAQDTARKILDGFGRIRLEVADKVFTIGGSVGIAFVDPGRSGDRVDAAALLGFADRACLRSKRFGGQAVQIHKVQSMDLQAVAAGACPDPYPYSFRGDELSLHSTPIMCFKRDNIIGLEVMLRLLGEGRDEGRMSSRAWFSAAERYGFMAQVDAWTLDKVLDAAEQTSSFDLITMNVSADSAREPSFRDVLVHRLDGNPMLASKLCLEFAERDFLREPSTIETFFRLAKSLGCQTALDDFAGHWPVLSRLSDLQIDWLKLDAGLTRQIAESSTKSTILKGLVASVHELGSKVIAKSVRDAGEADVIQALEIDAAQGPFFGEAEPWLGNRPQFSQGERNLG